MAKDSQPIIVFGIIGTLLLTISFATESFAANSISDNELDFDIMNIRVEQSGDNTEKLYMSVPVIYEGEFALGTVDTNSIETRPHGYDSTHNNKK
ncbi:hypothetical protein [Nitrosopumilus sp.]|uniref:hypothetical protein n=1 Tax=Nitrosopumilus sp. TaxID=2024843 RepID=UPI003B58BBD3